MYVNPGFLFSAAIAICALIYCVALAILPLSSSSTLFKSDGQICMKGLISYKDIHALEMMNTEAPNNQVDGDNRDIYLGERGGRHPARKYYNIFNS